MLIEITYNVTDVFMSTTETPVYVEISFEQPGGTSAVWGSITGTLSDQTDLQNALNAKLDESTIDGGTEGQILSKASGTDFDFAWINNYAKYLATNVRNQTGSTIGAFQVVYISGATGNKPLVSLADADTEVTSSKTYGVTATSIANNGTGDVVTAGELSGIDTSAFNEGDLLWLSTTAGGVVTTPPAEPAHAVFIGYVVRSHPTLGTIDVSIQNGYELNELHGVQITTPTDNQGLFYNSTSTLWENKSITTALGYTPVPTTRNITINGVTYDLSADRTWTIAAGISGSGASGQVTYWTGASAVSGSNNLFWDNANGRLGIGTNAPVNDITINKSFDGPVRLRIDNTSTGGNALTDIYVRNSTGGATFQVTGTGNTNPAIVANQARFRTDIGVSNGFTFLTGGTAPITFGTNDIVGMTMFGSTRNVGIGFTSDPAVRLGVLGDTLLRGSGNTSATTALTVQNSSSTNLFVVRNDGNVGIGTASPGTALHVVRNDNAFNQQLIIDNPNSGANAISYFTLRINSVDGGGVAYYGANYTNAAQRNSMIFYTQPNTKLGFVANAVGTGANQDIYFATKLNNTNATLFASGNLLIQNAGTHSDLGQRLQVIGDTLLRGSGATSATTALTVQNSSSTNLFTVRNDGNVGLRSTIPAVVHSSTSFMFVGRAASLTSGDSVNDIAFNNNSYFDGTNSIYKNSGFASSLFLDNAGDIRLFTAPTGVAGNVVSYTERFRLYNGGNIAIGGTFASDFGTRLQVYGDTLLRGSGATSATTALTVQNSSSTNLFRVANDGATTINTATAFTGLTIVNSVAANSAGRVNVQANTSDYSFFNHYSSTFTDGLANNGGFGSTKSIILFTDASAGSGGTSNIQFRVGGGQASNERMRIKPNGQVRFVPLASAPSGAEAGDVYYDSTLNKLRVYTTAWETITSI